MNRTTGSNDRYSRSGSGAGSRSGSRSGSGSWSGKGSGSRSGGRSGQGGGGRSGGYGRRPAAPQGEFALPVTVTPPLAPVTSFAELGLPEPLLAQLTSLGVLEPFPIQAATLPNTLAGRDVLGRGRTGSGKTLAFGLALLARTAGQRAEPRQPLALVLVPTRELAQQVTDALTPYARTLRLRMATVV
ncbi:DEAD/DEAH box helicase, partial [Streptomyces sp. NPDC051976]|uniref:DEAD/DEAH box helicase n=1 Tax=Streptomyces sp. NPDC051976 TaxID=3154947 RepID=UPI0034300377